MRKGQEDHAVRIQGHHLIPKKLISKEKEALKPYSLLTRLGFKSGSFWADAQISSIPSICNTFRNQIIYQAASSVAYRA